MGSVPLLNAFVHSQPSALLSSPIIGTWSSLLPFNFQVVCSFAPLHIYRLLDRYRTVYRAVANPRTTVVNPCRLANINAKAPTHQIASHSRLYLSNIRTLTLSWITVLMQYCTPQMSKGSGPARLRGQAVNEPPLTTLGKSAKTHSNRSPNITSTLQQQTPGAEKSISSTFTGQQSPTDRLISTR